MKIGIKEKVCECKD